MCILFIFYYFIFETTKLQKKNDIAKNNRAYFVVGLIFGELMVRQPPIIYSLIPNQ